ncbi:MAG: 30S ribosomal protein S6 [Candidatus Omnitrophica bacterium]|nr:30S ribosomal protein S6 [Candidatus Omnitrophota bacterium]
MEKARSYVGLFIITPDKEDVDEVTGSIKSVISENSGDITKENMVGKKKLAYPIKKKAEGVYYEISFNAAPESIANMTRQFRINTDLLRSLIDKSE